MINEEALINQIENENDAQIKVSYLLQYRNYWLSKGFENGWNRCMGDRKKTNAKLRESVVKQKNVLLDDLHDEIYKIGNDKNNLQS
jgi:hypothetical protein